MTQTIGKIIIKRIKSVADANKFKLKDFTSIIPLTKSTKHFKLSPYYLKVEGKYIFENWYQFSKIYKSVPKSIQYYSQYDNTVIWSHPAEVHIDNDNKITEKYWKWRNKGFNSKNAIRYPVGKSFSKKCVGTIKGDEKKYEVLDYISSRKQIYVNKYIELAKSEELFTELMERLNNGENFVILDIDGPHEESINYYKDEYDVDIPIIDNSIEISIDNMKYINLLLNDPKHPFGHAYCLGVALLKLENMIE